MSRQSSITLPSGRAPGLGARRNVNAYNVDVASPVGVQEFWKKHGELPGFAAGT